MKTVELPYGIAIYLNGKIVGWICKSINNEWIGGVSSGIYPNVDRTRYTSYREALIGTLKIFGE